MRYIGMLESLAGTNLTKPAVAKRVLNSTEYVMPKQLLSAPTKPIKTIQQEAEEWATSKGFDSVTKHDHDHVGHPGKAHEPNFLGEMRALLKTSSRQFWDNAGHLPHIHELGTIKSQSLETIKMAKDAHTSQTMRRPHDLLGANNGFTLPASDFFEFNVSSPTPFMSDTQFESIAEKGLKDLALDLAVNGTPKPKNWMNMGGKRASLKSIPNIQNMSAQPPE
jgi:hypothetical protein